jgi:hypothetical protein
MKAAVVRRTGLGLLAVLLVLGLPGCANAAEAAAPAVVAQESTTTGPPEETTVPDDSPAPEEPESVTDEPVLEPSSVPVWTWVVGLLILLAAIIWMVGRSGAGSGDNGAGTG